MTRRPHVTLWVDKKWRKQPRKELEGRGSHEKVAVEALKTAGTLVPKKLKEAITISMIYNRFTCRFKLFDRLFQAVSTRGGLNTGCEGVV